MAKYQHLMKSWPYGTQGQFDKIQEEYLELEDAHLQNINILEIIELSDLVYAIGRYSFKQYKIPLCMLIVFSWIRRIYKMFKNKE